MVLKDEKLGIEVAESREEALWAKMKMSAETAILQYEDEITVQKEMLKVAESKLKEIQKVE